MDRLEEEFRRDIGNCRATAWTEDSRNVIDAIRHLGLLMIELERKRQNSRAATAADDYMVGQEAWRRLASRPDKGGAGGEPPNRLGQE